MKNSGIVQLEKMRAFRDTSYEFQHARLADGNSLIDSDNRRNSENKKCYELWDKSSIINPMDNWQCCWAPSLENLGGVFHGLKLSRRCCVVAILFRNLRLH